MANKKISFEEAVKKLEQACSDLRSGDLPLEKSISLYEEAQKYYEIANTILAETKQKIEIYRPDTDMIEEFNSNE